MSVALLLGAGFSRWAANLPVANQLFDFAIQLDGPQESKKLDAVQILKTHWNKNHPNGLAEQFIADALKFPERSREVVLWYITRRLSEPFIWREFKAGRLRRHVLMVDEKRRLEILGVVRAQKFLQKFCGPGLAGIVTTNYDLLPEYVLTTKGFNYGTPSQKLIGRGPYPLSHLRNPVRLSGSIPIAKIHGSISWDEKGCYTDGRRGLTGHALIVAPTSEKAPPESLHKPWELAIRILQKTTQLIVFGFAFNPYDEAVLNLLYNSAANVDRVELFDLNPPLARAKALWPKAQIIASSVPN